MKSDFRMVWEALTTCPGTCSGCNIVKKTDIANGLWSEQQFKTASMHTKKLLRKNPSKRQKLFLNAGDYLYLPDDKLAMIFDYVDNTLDKDAESRVLLFTTSAIGKPEFISSRIDYIQKLLIERNLDCFPEIVFDFAKIKHKNYWKTYIDNFQLLSKAFPMSAINIQVGEDTFNSSMNQELFQEFISYCGVIRVEFVITPYKINAPIIKKVWNEAVDFLQETVTHLDKKNQSFIYPHTKTIQTILDNPMDSIDYHQELEIYLNNYISSSFYIGFNGDFSHFYSGLSNIYPFVFADDNLIQSKKINIFNNMYIEIDTKNILKQSVMFNNRVSMNNKCSSCEFKKHCNVMGNMLLIHNMGLQDTDKCPLNIFDYLTTIKNKPNVHNPEYEEMNSINLNYKKELNIE